ncbi:MAG: methyltransferase domain-containing protein [Alphaproteobacteria bacterium]
MAVAATAEGEAGSARTPLKLRLRAWWEGVDVADLRVDSDGEATQRDDAANEDAPGSEAEAEPASEPDWSEERIAAVEALWGHGHVRPGGDTFTLNFIRPMAPTPAMSIIDLRAGLGGPARALVDTFGLWIAGYEPCASLAAAGHERSIYGGMARKAPIQAYEPASLELKANRYDAAFAFELFSRIRDKTGLFERVVAALKEPGQLMFTEFALKERGEPNDAIVAWREAEPEIADLWTLDEYRAMCEDAGLDLRICDDFSDDYRAVALTGWLEAVEQFRPGTHEPPVVAFMLDEAERWVKRLAAIDSGDLRVIRVHAFKKAPPPK